MACQDTDYFEEALESSIAMGLKVYPVDMSDLDCIEIDYEEDLLRANDMFGNQERIEQLTREGHFLKAW